jgi:hypothetical protein
MERQDHCQSALNGQTRRVISARIIVVSAEVVACRGNAKRGGQRAWRGGVKVKHVFQLKNFNISTTETKYINKPLIQSLASTSPLLNIKTPLEQPERAPPSCPRSAGRDTVFLPD